MACRPILIIEDEADLRETMKDYLEISGYSVTTAANGRDALIRMDEIGASCLILLDLMMPVMNGWQFLDRLRQDRHEVLDRTPIVVVSAAADVSDVGRQYGCQVMKKPVDMFHLMSVVREHCECN